MLTIYAGPSELLDAELDCLKVKSGKTASRLIPVHTEAQPLLRFFLWTAYGATFARAYNAVVEKAGCLYYLNPETGLQAAHTTGVRNAEQRLNEGIRRYIPHKKVLARKDIHAST